MTIKKQIIQFQEKVEEIYSELDTTKDLQMIILEKVEPLNPDPYDACRIYRQMSTLGFVMFDRLASILEKTNNLLDQLYGKE